MIIRMRENKFYSRSQGVLLTRKRRYNSFLEAFELVSMYVVPTMENRCQCIKFTIFDYRSKRFSFIGIFENVRHIKDFHV